MNTVQIAALMYLLLYVFILVGFRGYLLYKRTGINPITSNKKTGLEGFIEKVFMVCFILIVVTVINFVFIENNYKYLIPIEYLDTNVISHIGIYLSALGLIIGFIAQLQMGDSWRLGHSENEKTDLVNRGLYAYSRNPIYLAYLVSCVGFFMMMPNAISLCFLCMNYVAVEVKIRLEEKHLKIKNGTEYMDYLKKVRRWI